MRFLQSEWHRHERDRNAWEIERAEMKSRVGRLEGDLRTSKRIQESLGKHVRMLELALKKERETVRNLRRGLNVEDIPDPKEIAKENMKNIPKRELDFSSCCSCDTDIHAGLAYTKPYTNPLSDSDSENSGHFDSRFDAERDRSRAFLSKAAQEVAYHVLPASHPVPELTYQDLQGAYGSQQTSQPSLEEAYLQQRQKQSQQINMMSAREPASQNHQPAQQPYAENGARSHEQTSSALERRNNEFQQVSLTAMGDQQSFGNAMDQNVHADANSQVPGSSSRSSFEDTRQPQRSREDAKEDTDGWNFDDVVGTQEPRVEVTNHHRPDTDVFPNANFSAPKSPPRGSHRRKSSGSSRRKSDGGVDARDATGAAQQKGDSTFKVRFALRGHLDVVRSVIFTGGGSPSEPEICTCSDDGTIKRWILPASYGNFGSGNSGTDLDITSYFTHRGHVGAVTALAACPPSQNFSNGGRALGDGWVFSGGQDASVRVWERGRVDPKATLDGHTDAVWGLSILPGTSGSVFGDRCSNYGGPDRMLLVSGGADGRILIWAVSTPPQVTSPPPGARRGAGGRRSNSISSGSNFPSSPQPSTATSTPFHYTLVHHIVRTASPSPTCISPLSLAGVNFVVSFSDASIIVYDTRTGEELVGMASLETYDGTPSTGVNYVVTSTVGFDGTANLDPNRGLTEEENVVHGATGTSGGVEGVIISGYEDRYIRFFDANSGKLIIVMVNIPARKPTDGLSRSMHVHDARAPIGHLIPFTLPRWPRVGVRRPRRQPAVLVPGKTQLHAGDHQSPSYARRGCLLRRVESGREMGGQRRR